MNGNPPWPAPHPTKGAALTAREAVELLGVSDDYVHVRLKRMRDGLPMRYPFPECDGRAVPSEGYRRLTMYWWTETIVEYGRLARLIQTPEPAEEAS
jgi:hypothetical protein